jgi:phosphatidylinositol alpha 1,6-mannosyltransferase
MSRFKLAIFTGNYNHIRDGVSLTLNRLVAFLERENVDTLVFGPTANPPAFQHTGTLVPVPSISMPGRPEYRITVAFPKNSRKKLEEFDPDIIHIATPDILGYKALRWAMVNNKPVVASYHTHFSSYLKYYKLSLFEPISWKYLRWFYSKCNTVFVPSESMADILELNGVQSNLKIWARGIEPGKFSPSFRSNSWREEKGFKKDEIVVTFISRLVWEKNLRLFADVVNRLRLKYTHVKPLIGGEGPALEEMKEMMPDAEFAGFLKGEELARAYASSDLFFFPSETETFGNVTLEAMASGLPCIVADATGSKSLVEHGVNGYLAETDKPDDFYNYIEKLIVDSELRKKMAANSLIKAGNYSWEVINSSLLECYTEVLEAYN